MSTRISIVFRVITQKQTLNVLLFVKIVKIILNKNFFLIHS